MKGKEEMTPQESVEGQRASVMKTYFRLSTASQLVVRAPEGSTVTAPGRRYKERGREEERKKVESLLEF